MIFAALQEAADRNELLLVDGGFCRFHLRRDGTLTIRELFVLPSHRRKGIGSILVHRACRTHHGYVVAKCPVEYPSNEFWKALGFSLIETIKGANLWRLDLT